MNCQALLLAALVDVGSLRLALEAGLTEEHFSQYPEVWEFLERYSRRRGKPPTREVIQMHFRELELPHGQGEEVGHLIESVKQDWLYLQVSRIMKSVGQSLTRENDPETALHLLQSQSRELAARYQTSSHDLCLVGDSDVFYDEAIARQVSRQEGTHRGMPTGIPTLDKSFGGVEPGELVTVVARQGEGKSWLLQHMAAASLLAGKKINYHALEMSASQCAFRLHMLAKAQLRLKQFSFRHKQLRMGEGYDTQDYRKFLDYLKQELESDLVLCDNRRNFSTVQVVQKVLEHRPDCTFVDYLTLISLPDRPMENWSDVRLITSDLKGIAQEYQVPVIVAAQANRTSTGRKGPPELQDIAFGDAIGMDSDRVISFKRVSKRVNHCRIIKDRHGEDKTDFWVFHDYNNGVVKEISQEIAMNMIDDDRGTTE